MKRTRPDRQLLRYGGLLVVVILAIILLRSRSQQPPDVVPLPSGNGVRLHVIDVGQGDALLLQFPDHETMLVDAGDRDHGPAVVRYLRRQGVKRIDLLVATHPHEDHIGGMADVLAAFPVTSVWDSGFNQGSCTQAAFLRAIQAHRIRYQVPHAGETRRFGDATIAVLAPTRLLTDTNSDANNNSLVLQVRYGATSALLAADMEAEERHSVRQWPASTILKVAHHGSHNGTDAALLRQVRPQLAVISYGKGNEYGHPHRETLDALRAANVLVRTTGDNGPVVITLDGKSFSVSSRGGSPAATATASSGRYIANVKSGVFHLSTCTSLPVEHNRRYFATRQAAITAGYHPCGRCKP